METANSIQKTLLSLIKDAKQGAILSNAMYEIEHIVSLVEQKALLKQNISPEQIENIIKNEISLKLAKLIINNKDNIKTADDNENKIYSAELIILKHKDLEEIVKYCIRTMPIHAIDNIRHPSTIKCK